MAAAGIARGIIGTETFTELFGAMAGIVCSMPI